MVRRKASQKNAHEGWVLNKFQISHVRWIPCTAHSSFCDYICQKSNNLDITDMILHGYFKPSLGVFTNHTESGPIWAEVFCEWQPKTRRLWESRLWFLDPQQKPMRILGCLSCCMESQMLRSLMILREGHICWKLSIIIWVSFIKGQCHWWLKVGGGFLGRYIGPRKKQVHIIPGFPIFCRAFWPSKKHTKKKTKISHHGPRFGKKNWFTCFILFARPRELGIGRLFGSD